MAPRCLQDAMDSSTQKREEGVWMAKAVLVVRNHGALRLGPRVTSDNIIKLNKCILKIFFKTFTKANK